MRDFSELALSFAFPIVCLKMASSDVWRPVESISLSGEEMDGRWRFVMFIVEWPGPCGMQAARPSRIRKGNYRKLETIDESISFIDLTALLCALRYRLYSDMTIW
ncbi:hypothetical protein WM15_26815 [Burkholderia ubonensis]|nr:hypothetical protein WM15_26815 [Burkholderia ubonensis]